MRIKKILFLIPITLILGSHLMYGQTSQEKLDYIKGVCELADEDAAIRCLLAESKRHPKNEHIWFKLGWYMQKRSLDEKAKEYYLECVRVNPSHAGAYINLGNIYLSRDDEKTAEKYYAKAMANARDLPDVHYNIGVLFMKKNNLQKAREHLHKSLEIKPDDPQAHLNYGVVYMRLYQENSEKKMLQYAKAHFLRAIELHSGYANAYYNLAMACEHENNPGLAIRYYREAARYYPDHSTFKRKSLNRIRYLESTR